MDIIFLGTRRHTNLLVLNNAEVEQLLDMRSCMEALRTAYRDLKQGLAMEAMARPDAARVALFGSGWQAGAQLLAAAAARPIQAARVFSPTPANRMAFAREWGERLGIPVDAVDTPDQAVQGADLVLLATSSLDPVFQAGWVQPGQFIGCIKRWELDLATLQRADRLVVHYKREYTPSYSPVGSGLGIQFAAVVAPLLAAARSRGLGRELPDEWFAQDVHT